MKNVILIISVSVVAILLFCIVYVFGTYNKAITLEENIHTSESNISKEEKRRVDLFNNLVDAVKSYNKFEKETFQLITDARSQANSGNVEQANLMLAAVVEAYPQLKSQENYKQAMLEFSITENRLADYREQFNNDVRGYNRLTRSFPSSVILAMVGYYKQDYNYLDYAVDNSKATNLFGFE